MRKLILFLLVTASCSRAISEPRDVSVGQQVELRTNQSARIANTSVVVTFLGANDSRCPSDVQCISAGEALIRLEFGGAGADRTDTLKILGQPRSTTYGDKYVFTVVSLLPYPVSTSMNADKTLTLSITKGL